MRVQPSQAEKNRAAQAAKASIHYTAPRETPLRGVTELVSEKKWPENGENPWEMMRKEWENHGTITKSMGKSMENHGKNYEIMGKSWENDGKTMEIQTWMEFPSMESAESMEIGIHDVIKWPFEKWCFMGKLWWWANGCPEAPDTSIFVRIRTLYPLVMSK